MAIPVPQYQSAGVNMDLAGQLLAQVKPKIKATHRQGVLEPTDRFGGMFEVDFRSYREPVLVSSMDGVGTKLLLAAMMNDHTTIGHDLVNHCINDIACQGAKPLYFLDYIGMGKLRNPLYEEVLTGLAEACSRYDVSLLGGETAEMPGLYGNDYDLVGMITGIVEKSQIVTGAAIAAGDVLMGLASNGLHTNGYSLARKVLFEQARLTLATREPESGESVGALLLKPHTCYWPAIAAALEDQVPLRGIAHITGGGIYDNLERILPDNVNAEIAPHHLPCPPIFNFIQAHGKISTSEMYRVFNMGVGMIWILPPDTLLPALKLANEQGFTAARIGHIAAGNGQVRIVGADRD